MTVRMSPQMSHAEIVRQIYALAKRYGWSPNDDTPIVEWMERRIDGYRREASEVRRERERECDRERDHDRNREREREKESVGS